MSERVLGDAEERGCNYFWNVNIMDVVGFSYVRGGGEKIRFLWLFFLDAERREGATSGRGWMSLLLSFYLLNKCSKRRRLIQRLFITVRYG